MPVEFIGLLSTRNFAEGLPPSPGPAIDLDHLQKVARIHEDGDFDSVLIGYFATGVDSIGVAYAGTAVTDKLRMLVAHRPGSTAPTLAARKFATLDYLSSGRITLNIIAGILEADMHRDGDWLPHDDRYERSHEYLDLMKLSWTSDQPFDYQGKYYHVEGARSEIKPVQKPHIPLYISGASHGAIESAVRHGDTYMLFGEPLAGAKERIDNVKAAAAAAGKHDLGFSISFRPILGATEEKAWERAHSIVERVQASRTRSGLGPAAAPESVGGQRLFGFASDQDIHDKRLYTGITRVTGAGGNSTALVGTPEQVAEAILDYIDLGATAILMRGYDPVPDAIEYGRDLIPLVRQEVARRDARRATEAKAAEEKIAVSGD